MAKSYGEEMGRRCYEMKERTGVSRRPKCDACGGEMLQVFDEDAPDLAIWWCDGCGSICYITGPETSWHKDTDRPGSTRRLFFSPASAPKAIAEIRPYDSKAAKNAGGWPT